jgi:regulator of sirC expression with transglutaminase-like and TPR domain
VASERGSHGTPAGDAGAGGVAGGAGVAGAGAGVDPGRRAVPALASESQVEAMISLLTDESEAVVEGCRRALRAHAEMAEPLLRERLGQVSGDEQAAVLAALVDLVGGRIEAPLVDHLVHAPELEAGSILIGRLIDPSEQPGHVPAALDAMADQVAAELGSAREPGRELTVLADVLVRQNGLSGQDPGQADAWDAVLHGVTLRQRGLPLALCMTWLLVARRVGVPLVGVNMPGHFLLRYRRGGLSMLVDPYHQGRAVREEECRSHLTSAAGGKVDLSLLDATDRDMLLRTLRNLVMIATRRGERRLAARCARILGQTTRLVGA